MEDYIFHAFLDDIKKDAKKRPGGPQIKPLDFENYKLTEGDGKMTLGHMAKLMEWLRDTLRTRAHQLYFVATYHKGSPRYWRKYESRPVDYDGQKLYEVRLDMEDFLESDSRKKYKKRGMPTYIPDNYELAKKVLKMYKGDKEGLIDNSCRECVTFQSVSYDKVKSIGDFIEKKFIEPDLNAVLASFGATDVKFSNVKGRSKLTFVYPKKKQSRV